MKAIIIGGGKGCRSLLQLITQQQIKELNIEVEAVVDVNPNAEGILYAKQLNLLVFQNYEEALKLPDIQMVIELTGNDNFLSHLKEILPPNIKLLEHSVAHIFWDLMNAYEKLDEKMHELSLLETRIESDNIFLKSIFNSLQDLAVVIDLDQRITLVNHAFCEFVKIKESEVIGKHCFEVLETSEISCDKNDLKKIIDYIVETKQPHSMIHTALPPNESHWEVTRSPIFDINGNVRYILSILHRITEIVKLKREIVTLEQTFQSFINNAQDWISMKNSNGEYIIVNPVIAKAFGKEPKDFIGRKPEDVLPVKIAETVRLHDKQVLQSKKPIMFDEIITFQGEDHHFKTLRFPLTNYKGDIIGTCTIGRDSTNEVRLMEKLIQSEKLAALGKLAAGVAHEINNPLTGILSFAEGIAEDLPPDSPLHSDIETIRRETLRCRDIVRNLLDFAKQSTPILEICAPNDIIKQTLDLIHRLPHFKNIELSIQLQDNIPKIKADFKQIQQVIFNLLLNAADAIKYKGKIIVSSEYYRQQKKCIISVEDTGPGIPENLMDKIFEPFFSTKSTSGLGLAVSWGIVERHNGTIEVDTAPTGGAIFRILLPAYFEK